MSELARYDPDTGELLARPPDQAGASLQAFTPDPQRAMLALGLHPQNPLTHAALLLANTYGLDPVLGHIKIIPGKGNQPATIWLTRDGYLFKALQHPEWGGLDLVKEDDGGGPPDGVYYCEVVCRRKGYPDAVGRAWYKWKQAKGQGGFYIDENADEMCLQRAERRALRRQFPLSIFAPELAAYLADDGEPAPVAAPAAVAEVAGRVAGLQTAGPAASAPLGPTGPAPNASEAGSRGNDATQAGREPPTTEAPTSPSAPSPAGGDGTVSRGRRGGRTGPGKAAPTDEPPAEPDQAEVPEQAAFEQTLADDDPGRWAR